MRLASLPRYAMAPHLVRMAALLLFAGLLVAPGLSLGQAGSKSVWSYVGRSTDGNQFYLMESSARQSLGSADMVVYSMRIVAAKPDDDGSVTKDAEMVASCSNRNATMRQLHTYNAQGGVVFSSLTMNSTRSMPPGTMGARVLDRACALVQQARAAAPPAPEASSDPDMRLLVRTKDSDFLMFKASLKFDGDTFSVVVMESYDSPIKDPVTSRQVTSRGYALEGDCRRSLIVTRYSRLFDADGNQVRELPRTGPEYDFRRVRASSAAFAVLKAACDTPDGRYVLVSDDSDSPSAAASSPPAESTSSGSGFVVSSQGHILTNNHVVKSCDRPVVTLHDGRKLAAARVAQDDRNDLALLKVNANPASVGAFRSNAVRPGEGVVALGYPLKGLLASEANVSTGTVSALAGLLNDTSRMQIQAPIQPGNSGGPLMDMSGLVIGVVVAKLDALAMVRATGDVPQNVNFGIKSDVARMFLASAGVEPRIIDSKTRPAGMSAADVAERGRLITALVQCGP